MKLCSAAFNENERLIIGEAACSRRELMCRYFTSLMNRTTLIESSLLCSRNVSFVTPAALMSAALLLLSGLLLDVCLCFILLIIINFFLHWHLFFGKINYIFNLCLLLAGKAFYVFFSSSISVAIFAKLS